MVGSIETMKTAGTPKSKLEVKEQQVKGEGLRDEQRVAWQQMGSLTDGTYGKQQLSDARPGTHRPITFSPFTFHLSPLIYPRELPGFCAQISTTDL